MGAEVPSMSGMECAHVGQGVPGRCHWLFLQGLESQACWVHDLLVGAIAMTQASDMTVANAVPS